MRFRGPRSEPLAEVYMAHAQRPYLILNVVLRASRDPRAIIPAVRQTLREVDLQKPAHGLNTLEDLMGATYVRDRQAMVTLLIFASTPIFLAVPAASLCRQGETSSPTRCPTPDWPSTAC
jgi:hypothetical protein